VPHLPTRGDAQWRDARTLSRGSNRVGKWQTFGRGRSQSQRCATARAMRVHARCRSVSNHLACPSCRSTSTAHRSIGDHLQQHRAAMAFGQRARAGLHINARGDGRTHEAAGLHPCSASCRSPWAAVHCCTTAIASSAGERPPVRGIDGSTRRHRAAARRSPAASAPRQPDHPVSPHGSGRLRWRANLIGD